MFNSDDVERNIVNMIDLLQHYCRVFSINLYLSLEI